MIAACIRGTLVLTLCVTCLSLLNGQSEILTGQVKVLRGYRCELIPAGSEITIGCNPVQLAEPDLVFVTKHQEVNLLLAGDCFAQRCFKGYFENDARVCRRTRRPQDTCRGREAPVDIKITHEGVCSADCACINLRRLPQEIPITEYMYRCNI